MSSAVFQSIASLTLHASVTSVHIIIVIALNFDLPIMIATLGLLISLVAFSYPDSSTSCALAHTRI
jgi:hypothetical protein